MDTTISIKTIEATDAFKNLSKVQQSFCLKRANRLILTNALIVHKNTGVIPSNIVGYNVSVLDELILGESVKFEEAKTRFIELVSRPTNLGFNTQTNDSNIPSSGDLTINVENPFPAIDSLSLKARRPCFSAILSNFIEKHEGNKLENLEMINKESKTE